MENIKWVFFDIGSTLVDESKVYERRFRHVAETANVPEKIVFEKAVSFYRDNQKGDLALSKFFGVSLPKWEPQYEVLYGEAEICLKTLHDKYSIGVIANQDFDTEERLTDFGLSQYIDLVVASAEEGVAKPDLRIFKIALDRADCSPGEAVMVGDRLDNDIVPAKKIGMKTVWIKRGFGGLAKVKSEAEQPDNSVCDLRELMKLFV